jgi:hypothetical protein
MAVTGYRSRLAISSVPLSGVKRLSGVGLHASPVVMVMTAGASSMTRRGIGTPAPQRKAAGRADERGHVHLQCRPLSAAASNCLWPVVRNLAEQDEPGAVQRTRYLGQSLAPDSARWLDASR